jgi:SAM-dependent methyltransferase
LTIHSFVLIFEHVQNRRTKMKRDPIWYWLRAIWVSRRDYAKGALLIGEAVAAALLTGHRLVAKYILGATGLGAAISLAGLFCMYGPPSRRYYRRLIELGGLKPASRVADLHVGTWRATWNLLEQLPGARIHSIDVWGERDDEEKALGDVRRLEAAPDDPRVDKRMAPANSCGGQLPLPTASIDAVMLGFGWHEVPADERETLYREIARILAPGGRVIMYERGWTVANFLVFGPAMFHFTRRSRWRAELSRFGAVLSERAVGFVDLFSVGG